MTIRAQVAILINAVVDDNIEPAAVISTGSR